MINYIESKSKSNLTPINPVKAKGITFAWVELMILLGILFGVFNAENDLFKMINLYIFLATIIVFICLLIKHSKKSTPILKAIKQRRLILCIMFFSFCAWTTPFVLKVGNIAGELVN